ncbi:MAG: hypothetical protein EOP56_15875 [Sphingobacteriales bacterium]|nr:MAG: hypothetical protein EOP56_15875 [Sphingobacteriales bacterium]
MSYKKIHYAFYALLMIVLLVSATGCNTTRHLKDGEYLLRSNEVKLKAEKAQVSKGEMKDALSSMTVQKTNNYWLGLFPVKLWLYNNRYKKYQGDTSNFQLKTKTVERPVIYDSTTIRRSMLNMNSYLFHEGFFYSMVKDTTKFKGKKAYVTYNVNTGPNYLINDITYDIDDPGVRELVTGGFKETVLKRNLEFSYNLTEQERTRIVNLLRNNGFYYISNDNVSFQLDTINKRYLEDIENPFQNAVNFVTLQNDGRKATLDIKVSIRRNNQPKAYIRYGIGRVRVYPDFVSAADVRDSTMVEKKIEGATFRYHNYYVHANVLYKHILLKTGKYYKQDHENQTISRMNDLGVFESVRAIIREDTSSNDPRLDVILLMAPAQRFDISPTIEGSTGSIYDAGSGVALSFRNRNLGKGANQLTISTNAAVEYNYNTGTGFSLLNRRVGANMNIDFPKFLIPGGGKISGHYSNAPRTLFNLGIALQDRVGFFTMVTTSSGITYRWKETETKTWEVSPAFVNIVRVSNVSDSFDERLKANAFLRNTYRDAFIEGQNISFTYSNREKRAGRNYSFLRVSLEEAGTVMGAVSSIIKNQDTFAQYVKLDIDAQHFFRRRHSTTALRLYTGIGKPYGKSSTLPYIKQYFSGGPYSIRGWPLRTLGPGSTRDTSKSDFFDRTGDVKLELNAEYRFNIATIFGGTTEMNGAVFADAGNIWLANGLHGFGNATFSLNQLPYHLAVSSGAGIRFDIAGFVVLRFDLGLRLKEPVDRIYAVPVEQGTSRQGWLFKAKFWPFDAMYLNPNFGIGYPF